MSIKNVLICIGVPLFAAALWSGTIFVRSALAEPPDLAPASERADFVEVDKSDRELRLLRDGAVFKTYKMSLGFAPEGDKQREGDGKTPEGRYTIDFRNPNSKFHLSLHINYPSNADKTEAAARGEPPGGDIFIHGGPRGVPNALWRGNDWTLGCISVTNDEIEEIWSLVPDGTPIELMP